MIYTECFNKCDDEIIPTVNSRLVIIPLSCHTGLPVTAGGNLSSYEVLSLSVPRTDVSRKNCGVRPDFRGHS